jgi:hypothetical protein
MTDTIDLLEAIGQDASLRHATAEELVKILEQAQASEALTIAATSGDRSHLAKELGHRECVPPQSTQMPAHEEEEEAEEGEAVPQPPQRTP